MNLKSKRTLVSMLTGVILFIAYIFYAASRTIPQTDWKAWATVLLVFIGISIGAMILIQIAFYLLFALSTAVKERHQNQREVERIVESAAVEDEMDKVISLKASQAGYFCSGAGLIATLAALALGATPAVALHILLAAAGLGSLTEGCLSIYFYERGVTHA